MASMLQNTMLICRQCNKSFVSTKNNKGFCSPKCYRKFPANAARYNARVNAYQKAHAKEPKRRYEKLLFKGKHDKQQCSITVDQYLVLIEQPCHYCGTSLSQETGCGLDRKDNTSGYHIDNVLPCCGHCNQIRNVHLTVEEMEVAMAAILNYRKQKRLTALFQELGEPNGGI